MEPVSGTIADKPAKRSVFSRRWVIIVIAATVAALSLGLGLGLGLHRDDSSDAVTAPAPTTTPTNGTQWQPAVGTPWQIVLNRPLSVDLSNPTLTPDVEIWDIDLFTNSAETISAIKSLGKQVICYFSAGSYESGRPDSDQFDKADIGDELDGWPGEYWLNLNSSSIRSIMSARIQLAQQKGCDAVDPDNVDGYQNENGLNLTAADSVDFVSFLAGEAAHAGLSIGLKNAGDIIPSVLPMVQFSVNEQCIEYEECSTFAAFVDAGKPVFHIEYPDGAPGNVDSSTVESICSHSGASEGSTGFSTVIKTMDLDGWVEYCGGSTATSSTSSGS